MARRLCELTIIALSSSGISGLFAQDPAASPAPSLPSPKSSPSSSVQKASPGTPPGKPWKKPDEFEEGRRFFEQLSPEQRQRIRDNLERWKNMPPEERNDMREREQFRREKIAQEIEESLRKSGLQLDTDHREVYALRYAQERRKIEDQLRKEVEARRRPMMRDMLERLKTEFNHFNSTPTLSPSSASPSPAAKP